MSIFCGVTIPDRNLDAVFDRFGRWRRSVIGHSKRELKGAELTDAQLCSFATKVLPTKDRDVWLTVVGVDTEIMKESHIRQLREQSVVILQRCSEIGGEHNNPRLKEIYRQMSGWIRGRSSQNITWIVGLEEMVKKSFQHTIIRYMEPEDDAEFHSFKIQIDESFVRKDEHVDFWHEWLRSGLAKKSNADHVWLPDTWRKRNHPFVQAYSLRPGLLNLNRLFVRDTGFFRSDKSLGLQIADICAHTIYRHYRHGGGERAYKQLLRRIVCRGGGHINMIIVNENSLHKDDPRNHAGVFDLKEYEQRADALRAAAPTPSDD